MMAVEVFWPRLYNLADTLPPIELGVFIETTRIKLCVRVFFCGLQRVCCYKPHYLPNRKTPSG